MVYEPHEDTHLLLRAIEKYAQGRVLDMGTGSCELGLAAAKKPEVANVLAVDIDEDAIHYCKERLAQSSETLRERITLLHSDLFAQVEGEFDTIIFNPPYLPSDARAKDVALDGGEEGHELIGRFLEEARDHLAESGVILLLFSSLTNQERVLQLIKEHGYRYEEELEAAYFFERLYVYALWKRLDG